MHDFYFSKDSLKVTSVVTIFHAEVWEYKTWYRLPNTFVFQSLCLLCFIHQENCKEQGYLTYKILDRKIIVVSRNILQDA
jgi:hypothetical protein